jgi:hypothetical protein
MELSLSREVATQLLKKFPTIYGIRRFFTVSKKPHAEPYPDPNQSRPYNPFLFLSDLS